MKKQENRWYLIIQWDYKQHHELESFKNRRHLEERLKEVYGHAVAHYIIHGKTYSQKVLDIEVIEEEHNIY